VENIRIFAGIACPPAQRKMAAALMNRLAAALPFRKWTHPDDLHVTLHFIGETPPQRLGAIRRVLEETAAQFAPLTLAFAEPGVFGPPDAPRILWLGLREPEAPGSLKRLHDALRPGLVAAGCRLDEKPFRAHMTLARQAESKCGPEAVRTAWTAALADERHAVTLPWEAGGITLFRSRLGRRPSYETIGYFPFGGE